MDTLNQQLITVCEQIERAKLLRKLLHDALLTNNLDIIQFVNNFDKENK